MTTAYAEANGAGILFGRVCLPRVGAWTAALTVESEAALGPEVTLSFAGGLELRGTARALRSGVEADTAELQVVGGRAGLGKALPAKFYGKQVPVRLPLQDIVQGAGEVLSGASDTTILERRLPSYSRMAGTAGHLLALLVSALGTSWRVESGGAIRVGPESWPVVSPEHEVLRTHPAGDRVEVYEDAPSLLPGVIFLGRKVSAVEVIIEPPRLRTVVWWER